MMLENLVLLNLIIKKLRKNLILKFLGPEPLENIFNFKYFKNYIKEKKNIKDLINGSKVRFWIRKYLCK